MLNLQPGKKQHAENLQLSVPVGAKELTTPMSSVGDLRGGGAEGRK